MKNERAPRIVSSGSTFAKIMSGENIPDHDPRKCFQFLANVDYADFKRQNGKAYISIFFRDGDQEEFEVVGNCYLLNEAGDTVASFGASAISPRLAA